MHRGSLIMALAGQGKTKGMVAELEIDAYGNQSLACISDYRGSSRFLLWWLNSLYRDIRALSSQETRDGLNQSILGRLPVPLFDHHTQKAIAAFLDRETARIDQLIDKKQRLVELLGDRLERITERIAAGVDEQSDSKKSTGLDWLPSVPEDWETGKLFWLFRPSKGRDAQKYTKEYCATVPGPYPVFSGQTADGGVMGEIDSYDYDVGDRGCLFATTVGAKAMSLRHITCCFSLSQNCMILTPRSPSVHVRFYLHHLQALFRRERELIPKHMQPSFRVEDMRRYRVAIVPPEQAAARALVIDEEHDRVSPLVQRVERSIDRLKEYRSALITAAVTGQIDVETWRRRGESDHRLDRIEEEMAG
jgi:type I restriction enzyme S subunit